MLNLNLDIHFKPYGEGIAFELFTFSGGEPHIKIEPFSSSTSLRITTRVRSFNDMGMLLIAVDALNRMGVKEKSLFLPYFPGARQDRLMIKGEPLTVKVYADLINNLNFSEVEIFDPHSEVTSALLNNVKVIDNNIFVKKALEDKENYVLIAPDGGSLKKIYKTAAVLGGRDVVECSKTRDVTTGKLSGFKVGADDLKGQTCVIVDDICDGGGTFLGLAEALKAKNAGNLILIVSHGIFSKGVDKLKEYYDEIITTDSFKDQKGVTEIKLKEILNM